MSHPRIRVHCLAQTSLAVLLVLGGVLPGCKRAAPAVPWASGTTIIPGSCGWDVETDSIVDPTQVPAADFWWEMVSESQRYLTPTHDAVAAVVKGKTYEQIDAAFVAGRRLREGRIDGSDKTGVLDPGTIIVFRTPDGTLGKLQIVGYRALHDLSFPEARAYPDRSKSTIAQHRDIERGHIEVKWQLYRPQAP